MPTPEDAEIQRIVDKVVRQAMGESNPASAPLPAPAPKEQIPDASLEARTAVSRLVVIGSDHGGFDLKETLKAYVAELGYEVQDLGAYNKNPVDYPDFAHEVASRVSSGKAWRGVMIDGAGIGSCIVANKLPGVRAGMAYDISSASNSREHNDTNVLTLGAGLIGMNLARQIVKTWLTTEFGGGRHAPRVEKITAVEKQYLK